MTVKEHACAVFVAIFVAKILKTAVYMDTTTDHITPCSRMRARGKYVMNAIDNSPESLFMPVSVTVKLAALFMPVASAAEQNMHFTGYADSLLTFNSHIIQLQSQSDAKTF